MSKIGKGAKGKTPVGGKAPVRGEPGSNPGASTTTTGLTPASARAREYCEMYPHVGNRALGRMLVADFPELFSSPERATWFVRYHRGAAGSANMTRNTLPALPVPDEEFGLDADYVFPIGKRRLKGVIMSDWQIPYYDKKAVECAINLSIAEGHTDFALINGDFFDCYGLSDFEKDPRMRPFADEVHLGNQILDLLGGIFKRLVFKLGNHEDRLTRYMYRRAPALVGLSAFGWRELLRADERKMPIVGSGAKIVLPNLTIVHGHEFGSTVFSPVNPARGLFIRAKANAIQGHCHQTSHHSEGTLDGRRLACWSTGCLCSLRPRYRPLADTKWNHGVALLGLYRDEFEVRNYMIIDGRAYSQ